MNIPVTSVFIDATRLRQDYGDLKDLADSFVNYGQWYPILVKPIDREEFPEAPESCEWSLYDGGRRLLAMKLLTKLGEAVKDLEPGEIRAEVFIEGDPIRSLEVEFHANEDRKQFDWKEKADFVKRIHEMHRAWARENDEKWTVKHTAQALGMSEVAIYQYLQIVADPEIFGHKKVQSAKSFRTAAKQAAIVKERKERERLVEAAKTKAKEAGDESSLPDDDSPEAKAANLIANVDCREWIPHFPDETFDWIHWDPPYGGEQAGGAHNFHLDIDDSWAYAYQVHRAMVPEIYRTLKDGRWLAIWCHPTKVHWLTRFLQGHMVDDTTYRCLYCEKKWNTLDPSKACPGGEWAFWVNPYPNIWNKVNRESDGHEIKRFGINAYENFLFAAKVAQATDPILIRNDWKNVFTYPMDLGDARRHVMQKPVPLLKEILSIISVRGELGADPSVGSGTSLEAAFDLSRKAVGCELEKEYWIDAVHRLANVFTPSDEPQVMTDVGGKRLATVVE